MPPLWERVGALWRMITTPRAVREVEDAGPEQAADALPAPPPVSPAADAASAREVGKQLDRIEYRNREYARLYERRRENR